MKHDDLPERWKQKVIQYLRDSGETKREKLSACDFFPNQIVQVNNHR